MLCNREKKGSEEITRFLTHRKGNNSQMNERKQHSICFVVVVVVMRVGIPLEMRTGQEIESQFLLSSLFFF